MVYRVLLADDHPSLRLGLRVLLETDPAFRVVAEAGDGEAALAAFERLQPDLAVLDIRLPRRSGLEVAREIRSRRPSTRILLLSAYDDPPLIEEAIAIGVEGYLLKTEDLAALAAAVRSVAQGGTAFSPTVLERIRTLRQTPLRLTPREQAILSRVAAGWTNREIARHLGLSERTVEYHLERIFQKLGVRNRAEAVREALRHGWLSPEP